MLSVSEFIQLMTVMKRSWSTAHPGKEQTREQLAPSRANFISRKEGTLCTCEVVNRSYVNITKVSCFKMMHPDACTHTNTHTTICVTHLRSMKNAVADRTFKSFCHSIACYLLIQIGEVALFSLGNKLLIPTISIYRTDVKFN